MNPALKTAILAGLLAAVLAAGTAAAAGPAQAPRIEGRHIVVDQAGRRLAVAKPFDRIISLYAAHTENLFALGAGRKLIGVSRSESYPPEALRKPRFSYHDDPEKFLAARPDLVLIRPMIDRAYPQLIGRLEHSGIQVVSLQPAAAGDMFAYWKILGRLTDRQARADEMVHLFEAAAAELRALARLVTVPQRVYFEAIHSKMKTFTPQAMAIFALEAAGGINIAADARQVRTTNIAFYGKERILSKAGQIDVYLAQHGAMNRSTVRQIKNEPGFQIIRAVKNDRIYIIDEMITSRPTLRLLQGIVEIGSLLYPEVFDERAGAVLKRAGLCRSPHF